MGGTSQGVSKLDSRHGLLHAVDTEDTIRRITFGSTFGIHFVNICFFQVYFVGVPLKILSNFWQCRLEKACCEDLFLAVNYPTLCTATCKICLPQ